MADIQFTPPTKVDFAEIARSPEVQARVDQLAREGMEHAKDIAPVDTGAFRDAFHVERFDAYEVDIINTDPGAIPIEYGSEDTPAHHTLALTADYLNAEVR